MDPRDLETLLRSVRDGRVSPEDAAERLKTLPFENLDLEAVARVADGGDRVQQALHHVHLVVERQLHRHRGQLGELAGRARLAIAVAVVHPHQRRAVEAIEGEDQQDDQVGGDDR